MGGRSRPLAVIAFLIMGFVAVVAVRARPASPESRVPRQYQLAALIDRERKTTTGLQRQVEDLRKKIDELRTSGAGQEEGTAALDQQLQQASATAGLAAMRGAGLRVTLDDSKRTSAPSGNVNDLVVHSQDVQAVVNALWHAGAEAVAINDQRLVGTSAVLCVGNTLLLNGSVESPPYEVSAIGAARDRFETDTLVKRLHADSDTFGLRFSVTEDDKVKVPAYAGTLPSQFARPLSTAG